MYLLQAAAENDSVFTEGDVRLIIAVLLIILLVGAILYVFQHLRQ